MATYIPGIQSYLPAYTPFTPDVKLTSMLMEQRQDRYNTNHRQLSDLYGSVVYADLSRQDTQEQRDYFANNLSDQIQKISSTDLSLQQNADAAKGVFKPFLENNLIQQDIFRTARYKNELNRAQSYAKSSNLEENNKYSELHMQALQFQMEDFVNANPDEALGMAIPEYVPAVNLYEEAKEYLKESGIEAEDFYFTPDNKWLIKQKNGSLIENVAFDAVARALANNPRVQKSYATDSYVKARMFAQQGVESGKFASINEGKMAWAQSIITDINNKAAIKEQLQKGNVKEAQELAQRHVAYVQETGENVVPQDELEAMLKAKQEAERAEQELNVTQDTIALANKPLSEDQTATLSKAYAMLMNWNMNDELRAAAKNYSMQGYKRDAVINGYQRDIESHKLAMIKQRAQQAFTREENRKNRDNRLKAAYIKNSAGESGGMDPELKALLAGASGASVTSEDYSKDADPNTDVIELWDQESKKIESQSNAQKIDVLLKHHQLKYAKDPNGKSNEISVGEGSLKNKAFELWKNKEMSEAMQKLMTERIEPLSDDTKQLTIEEARAYYSKPENQKELEEKYRKITEKLSDEEVIKAEMPGANVYQVNALKSTMRDIEALDLQMEYGEEVLYEKVERNLNILFANPETAGMKEIEKDIKNNVPKIINNGVLLAKDKFVEDIVKKAESGESKELGWIWDSEFKKTVKDFDNVDPRTKRIGTKEVFDKEAATKYAEEAYDRQISILNRTLDGSFNMSDDNPDGSKTFESFGVYDFMEGKPTENMNDNSYRRSTTINAGLIFPLNLQAISAGDQSPSTVQLKSFLSQISQPESVQFVPGLVSEKNKDEVLDGDPEKAETLMRQIISRLGTGMLDSDQKKKGMFTLKYAKTLGYKDGDSRAGTYIVTFDENILDDYIATKTGEEGSALLANTEKNKFRTISILVNKEQDANPQAIGNINRSVVDVKIQRYKKYEDSYLNGGNMFIYKDQDNYYMGGSQTYFDPNSKSYKVTKSAQAQRVNYRDGRPVLQNAIQDFADGASQKLKENSEKVTAEIEAHKAKLKENK